MSARPLAFSLTALLLLGGAGCNPFAPALREECKQFIASEVARLHPDGTVGSQRQTAWSKLDRPRPGYNAEVGDVLFTNVELTVKVGERRLRYRAYCPNTSAFPKQKHKLERIADK